MIKFDLVSPEKKLFSAPVAMVTLPGSEGDFGVLPGHAPFISTMRVGVIDIYESEHVVSTRIMVSGGVVEVNPQQCTVLAEEATNLQDLSRDGLDAELKKYRDLLQVAANDADRQDLEEKITRTAKKLEIYIQSAAH